MRAPLRAMYRPELLGLLHIVTTTGEGAAGGGEVSASIARVRAALAELDTGQERCRRRASAMGRYSAASISTAVGAGALIVIHATFNRFMSDTSWMDLPLILLGVIGAIGAGFAICLRPSDRAARWTAAAREFRTAAITFHHRADGLAAREGSSADAWSELAASADAAIRRLTSHRFGQPAAPESTRGSARPVSGARPRTSS